MEYLKAKVLPKKYYFIAGTVVLCIVVLIIAVCIRKNPDKAVTVNAAETTENADIIKETEKVEKAEPTVKEFYENGQYDEVIEYYQAADSEAQKDAEFYLLASKAYLHKEQPCDAMEALNKGLETCGGDGELLNEWKNYIIENTVVSYYFIDGVVTKICRSIEYDNLRRPELVNGFDLDGNTIYRITYEYDSDDEWIKETYYDSKWNTWKWSEGIDDKSGVQTECRLYEDFELVGYNEYEYDKSGNRIKESRYRDGELTEVFQYEYDADGIMTQWTSYRADGSMSGWHEYDDNGDRIKWISYDENEIESSSHEYTYEHDVFGHAVACHEKNQDDVESTLYNEYRYQFLGDIDEMN